MYPKLAIIPNHRHHPAIRIRVEVDHGLSASIGDQKVACSVAASRQAGHLLVLVVYNDQACGAIGGFARLSWLGWTGSLLRFHKEVGGASSFVVRNDPIHCLPAAVHYLQLPAAEPTWTDRGHQAGL